MLKLLTQEKQPAKSEVQPQPSEAQSAADVEMRDANEQSLPDQQDDVGDIATQFVNEKRNKDNLFKLIDMQ